MQSLYSLVLASGTKEALFAALWLALGEEPGKLADVDFATVGAVAARFGVALSESQIRKRVKELEALGVLEIAPRRERGRFDLFVYQPAPARFLSPPVPEPATPLFDAAFGKGVEAFADVPGDSVSAAVSEMEMETATAAAPQAVVRAAEKTKTPPGDHFREVAKMMAEKTPETPEFARSRVVRPLPAAPTFPPAPPKPEPAPEPAEPRTDAAPLEEINNKYIIINKTINPDDFGTENVAPSAPSVADVRAAVDFESPKVAAFRRLVARNVWERSTHPDLIDRLVAIAVLRIGGATASTVEAMIRDAKDAVALWNRTDGRRGQPLLWRALTPEVKRLYENAGWRWAPTRFATEPRPERRAAAVEV